MTARDSSDSWLIQADADLAAAHANADQDRHALACFLSHDAAVKAVKAYLLWRDLGYTQAEIRRMFQHRFQRQTDGTDSK